MQGPEPRSRAGVIFDAVSVVLFVAAWLGLLASLVVHAGPLRVALAAAVLVLPALLAAELGAGLFHWFADTFFTPETPWIGPTLIKAFRDHHAAPGHMGLRSAAEVSGQNCFACVLLLAPALPLELRSAAGCAAGAGLLLLTLGIALTNLFHQWAHAEHVHPVVARLQRSGWILSPEHHALHHRDAHDRAYCVTTGWLNPVLDGVGFFPALERAVRRFVPAARRPLARSSQAQ